jgi:hypothetical protein
MNLNRREMRVQHFKGCFQDALLGERRSPPVVAHLKAHALSAEGEGHETTELELLSTRTMLWSLPRSVRARLRHHSPAGRSSTNTSPARDEITDLQSMGHAKKQMGGVEGPCFRSHSRARLDAPGVQGRPSAS